MSDFYLEIRKYAKQLETLGFLKYSSKLLDAIEKGSTGGEIVMALRHNLQELLKSEELSDAMKQQAKKFISKINDTGW